MRIRTPLLAAILLAIAAHSLPAQAPRTKTTITWKKTVVDKVFRSEGVAVVDVNKDGKPDIVVGDVWYEAPNWKMHPLRKERFKSHDPAQYSDAFAVFADDFNGDGYPDVIVIPFPGAECFWYENPMASRERKRPEDELWKEHHLTNSACNETPIYVDLFKTGKKVLVMGWNPPPSKDKTKKAFGEVCFFQPGNDPTKPWERISISGDMGRDAPGSGRFYHGLGAGDINGDGRLDVITPDGWWEQPEKLDGKPWKWHPTKIGSACADVHVMDIDGDGKPDVISSSAHGYGLWWHQQRAKDAFLTLDLFPTPPQLAKESTGIKLNKEEQALFAAVNKFRESQRRAPWRLHQSLCWWAQRQTEKIRDKKGLKGVRLEAKADSLEKVIEELRKETASEPSTITSPNLSVGVCFKDGVYVLVVAQSIGDFSLPGQTHALHLVDINGDGLKDLVTGRRWWAHGANGDVSPADPAYLYWFEAKKDATGIISFTPHMIDDDSGIGTQFAVVDINGDGLLDVVISNKKGVFIFEQVRTEVATKE